MRRSSVVLFVILLIALAISVAVLHASFQSTAGQLRVAFLDVGQGDATLIISPTGRQVLIDGGPDSAVIRELSRALPWYDRSLDAVIGTHADSDHIGGLIDVLERYRVSLALRAGTEGTTATAERFEKEIDESGARTITAHRGQLLEIGGGAYIEILFPDRPLPHVETNLGCIVARVVYGATALLLPCDTTSAVERYLARLDGTALQSTVLKAAHHGSKTSSLPLFVGFVGPEYAVISRGCDNSYGHPHQQTLDTLALFEIPVLDTCDEGTVTFVSDGQKVRLR